MIIMMGMLFAGMTNALAFRPFHELSVYQRVWIVKSLCDCCAVGIYSADNWCSLLLADTSLMAVNHIHDEIVELHILELTAAFYVQIRQLLTAPYCVFTRCEAVSLIKAKCHLTLTYWPDLSSKSVYNAEV